MKRSRFCHLRKKSYLTIWVLEENIQLGCFKQHVLKIFGQSDFNLQIERTEVMWNLLTKFLSKMNRNDDEVDSTQEGAQAATQDDNQAGPSRVEGVLRSNRVSFETVSDDSDWPTGPALSTTSTSPTEVARWLRGELVRPRVEIVIDLSSGPESEDINSSDDDSEVALASEVETEAGTSSEEESDQRAPTPERRLRQFRGTSVRMLVLPDATEQLWADLEDHLSPYSFLFLPPQVVLGTGTYGYDEFAHFCAPLSDEGIVEVYCPESVPIQGDVLDRDRRVSEATYMMAYPAVREAAWRPQRRWHQRYAYTRPPTFPVPDELLARRQRRWSRFRQEESENESDHGARPQTAKRGRR